MNYPSRFISGVYRGKNIFQVRHGWGKSEKSLLWWMWDLNPRPEKPMVCRRRHLLRYYHLGTTRTLRMHAGAFLLVDWHECVHPVVASPHCLKCQARKTPRLTSRWPIITMPLPEGPGVAVSVDYFGHHEATSTSTSCC